VKALLLVAALVAPASAQRTPGWELKVPERIEVAVGEAATLPIAIAIDRGLTVSKDAPVIVTLAPDPGVVIKKRRLGRADAVDPEADAPRFAIPVRGDTAGEHVVRLHVKLWLCGGKVCKPLEIRRQTSIVVAPQIKP
jgi:hypothetical protein